MLIDTEDGLIYQITFNRDEHNEAAIYKNEKKIKTAIIIKSKGASARLKDLKKWKNLEGFRPPCPTDATKPPR